ncbi:MAG: acyl carrier protein [Planctomycetia bacterium]|nr:acyl carrier protein [Planctomycetia bacterium]
MPLFALRPPVVIRYPPAPVGRRSAVAARDSFANGDSPDMERKELSAIVLELLEKETGETYPALQDSTSLREGLNLDSLDMAGLVLHVESRFGIQIETELLEEINTVGDMLTMLEKKLAAKEGRKAA